MVGKNAPTVNKQGCQEKICWVRMQSVYKVITKRHDRLECIPTVNKQGYQEKTC